MAQIDRRCGRKLSVEPSDLLGVDADPAALMTLLVDPATAEAVLCSHGELIGTALRQLAAGATDADSLVWPRGVDLGCWRRMAARSPTAATCPAPPP